MPKPGQFVYDKHHQRKCFVTGWGRRTESKIVFNKKGSKIRFIFQYAASEHSLVLKEINVPLWNHDSCNGALQAQFGPAYALPSTTICAGEEGRDACDVSISVIFWYFLVLFDLFNPEKNRLIKIQNSPYLSYT